MGWCFDCDQDCHPCDCFLRERDEAGAAKDQWKRQAMVACDKLAEARAEVERLRRTLWSVVLAAGPVRVPREVVHRLDDHHELISTEDSLDDSVTLRVVKRS